MRSWWIDVRDRCERRQPAPQNASATSAFRHECCPRGGFNVPGMFNFKWLRVAEMAHATTIARLIGRLVFSDMTWINFSRAEIYATIQANWLPRSSRLFVIAFSVRSTWLAASGYWPVRDHALRANSPLVDRVDVPAPLSLSTRSVAGLSAHSPRSGWSAATSCIGPKLPTSAMQQCRQQSEVHRPRRQPPQRGGS
jgi:hypothetical protein